MKARIEEFLESSAATRLIGWMTLACMILMIVLAFLTVPGIISNTEASRRTDELNTCRAGYRAEIDIAKIALDRAEAARQDVQDRMLQAIGRQDATTAASLAAEQATTQAEVDAAVIDVESAASRYQDENRLSQTDPALFLSRCKESP